PVVLEPDAGVAVEEHDVVADDRGSSADDDAGAGPGAHDDVALHDAAPEPVTSPVHHDPGTLGVDDHVVANNAGRVELDLKSVADLWIWGIDVPDEVFFHPEPRHHALDAFVAAEVHPGGAGVGDDVPEHGEAGDARVVGRDRDAAQSVELATREAAPGPREDADAIDSRSGRAESQALDGHVVGLDVQDVGRGSAVDDAGPLSQIGRANEDRRSGPPAPLDRTGPGIVAGR